MPASRIRSQLIIIDVQEKLAPHLGGQGSVIANDVPEFKDLIGVIK